MTSSNPHRDPAADDGGPARATTVALAIIALTAVAFAVLIATGFLRFTVEGAIEAPRIDVTGGALPEIGVETGRVALETEERIVEVPKLDVEPAGKGKRQGGD